MKTTGMISLILLLSFALPVHAKGDDRKGDTPVSELSRGESRRADIVPGSSSSYSALVKEFLQVTHANEIQDKKIEQVAQEASQGAKDPVKAKTSAAQFYSQALSVDSMLPSWTEFYHQRFSEDEMKKLIEFYKSPLGQKSLAGLPEVAKQIESLSQQRLQTRTREFNLKKSQMAGFR